MNDLTKVLEDIKQTIVVIKFPDGRRGSGFFINEKGLLITNKHIVELNTYFKMNLHNGDELEGQVVYSDNDLDVAFAIASTNNAMFAHLGNSELIKEGQQVIAIGHPYGYDFSISRGIISCKNRIVKSINYIQIDVAINPGNSGGPLITIDGDVIGMNTWAVQDAENMGFAVPTQSFLPIIGTLNTNFDKLLSMYYCPVCGYLSGMMGKTSKGEYCKNCGTAKRQKKKDDELQPKAAPPQSVNVGSLICQKCKTSNDTSSFYCKKCGYKIQ